MVGKTILIADDDRQLVQVLTKRCEHLGLDVKTAFDANTALSIIRRGVPDLVCVDVNMPYNTGLELCEEIRACMPVPVIVLTGRTDAPVVKKCHELCAYYVLKCEDVWSRLEPLICEILQIGAAPAPDPEANTDFSELARRLDEIEEAKPVTWTAAAPANVSAVCERPVAVPLSRPVPAKRRPTDCRTLLVVEDDLDMVRTIKSFVARTGLKVVHCEGLEDTAQLTRQAAAILCDIHLRDFRGTFIVHELRGRGVDKPVIMMSGDNRKETMLESVSAGIDAILLKPFRKQQLLEVLRRHTGLVLDERAVTRTFT